MQYAPISQTGKNKTRTRSNLQPRRTSRHDLRGRLNSPVYYWLEEDDDAAEYYCEFVGTGKWLSNLGRRAKTTARIQQNWLYG
jgi:hypothetical protein